MKDIMQALRDAFAVKTESCFCNWTLGIGIFYGIGWIFWGW